MKHVGTGVLAACAVAGLLAQALTVDELLFRANESVIGFEQLFSTAVTEEQYVQRIVRADGTVVRERRVRSDLLLILLPGADRWLGFRDVFEVEGEPVRDRDQRLQNLFLGESVSPHRWVSRPGPAIDQARAISRESARYNIGDVTRTINLPTVALGFLHPLTQHRFMFEKIGEESIGGRPVWVTRYSEHVQPTIVQSQGGDMFAYGRFWLDVDTGQALRTEVILGDGASNIRSTITVEFRRDESLDTWVPDTMVELYDNPSNPREDRIEATATYSNFRQFGVTTETLAVPR